MPYFSTILLRDMFGLGLEVKYLMQIIKIVKRVDRPQLVKGAKAGHNRPPNPHIYVKLSYFFGALFVDFAGAKRDLTALINFPKLTSSTNANTSHMLM